MICKRCEQTYSDALSMCPYCGAPKEQQPTPPQGQQAQPGMGQPDAGQQAYVPPQPPYNQAPPYQAPYNQAPVQEDGKGRGMGAASLVCGILGLILCWVPFLGLILNILAIALHGSARKHGPNGMTTAGLVLGIIGLIVAVIVTVLLVLALVVVGTAASLVWPFL